LLGSGTGFVFESRRNRSEIRSASVSGASHVGLARVRMAVALEDRVRRLACDRFGSRGGEFVRRDRDERPAVREVQPARLVDHEDLLDPPRRAARATA
jgi:hypothetical protein